MIAATSQPVVRKVQRNLRRRGEDDALRGLRVRETHCSMRSCPARALTRPLGTVTFSPLDPSAQIACTDHAEELLDLLFRRMS